MPRREADALDLPSSRIGAMVILVDGVFEHNESPSTSANAVFVLSQSRTCSLDRASSGAGGSRGGGAHGYMAPMAGSAASSLRGRTLPRWRRTVSGARGIRCTRVSRLLTPSKVGTRHANLWRQIAPITIRRRILRHAS